MDIDATELKRKLDNQEEFVFIDVRELYEYEEFNLGGRLIPLGELMAALDGVSENKHAEIIVYCRSGNRSAMAQHLLLQAGYTNVRNLTGGIVAWKQHGY